MSLLTKWLYGTAGATLIGLSAVVAWMSVDRADLKSQISTLEAANVELADGARQAKLALDAITEQAGECHAELMAAEKSCDERLTLWKQAKTVPITEAPDEILDRRSSDAYTDSIDRLLERLRK